MKRGIKEMNIILASGSPRRKELLAQAGFDFEVEVSNADENVAEESPTEMVEELAARKAEAVVNLHNKKEDNCLVIGADTIVTSVHSWKVVFFSMIPSFTENNATPVYT